MPDSPHGHNGSAGDDGLQVAYRDDAAGSYVVVPQPAGYYPSAEKNATMASVNAPVSPAAYPGPPSAYQGSQSAYPGVDSYMGAPPQKPPHTILGLRRTTFFLILSNIALAIALIVVGVVEGHNANNNDDDASAASRSNNGNAAASCPTASSTTSSISSSSTTSSSDSSKPTVCFVSTSVPANAGTIVNECPLSGSAAYTVPGTNLTFQRQCGIDYPARTGTQFTTDPNGDMARLPSSTMEDCLAVCAQMNLYNPSAWGNCVGVSWNYVQLQGENLSFCYLKNKTTQSGGNANVESAILLS